MDGDTLKDFNCKVILFWSEVKRSYGEVIGDKVAMYISVTLYWGYMTILCLFHLGISCTVFVLICTVVLYCFVICVCVCVCVCLCVCVCVCVYFGNMYTVLWGFSYPDWGFTCFFLSCKANARVKLAKTGHGPHSSTLVCICVVRLLFVLFYVLFVCKCVLPPGDNPTAVNKYIIS